MKSKYFILIAALFVLGMAPLLAVPTDYSPTNPTYKQSAEPFIGTSVRLLGMGGAGLGAKGYYDSFLVNPANLAKAGFNFSFPSITVTAFNPKAILESGMIEDFAEGEDGMVVGAEKFLNTIKKVYGDVLTTDISTTITLGSFGLSLQAQERLMSYKTDYRITDTNLIAQVTTAATVGFGFRINLAEKVSIDLGVAAQAVYKVYLEAISGNTIIDMINNEDDFGDKFINDMPLIGGYALPLSAGVNFNLPGGLTLSTVAKNLNGNYTMNTFQSMNDWAEEVLNESFGDDTSDDAFFTSTSFTIDSEWTLDTGLTWEPNIGSLIRPIIAVDVLDVLALSGKTGDDLTNALLSQIRFGASARLLSLFDFRYGLNQGYQSIGVGFDLLIFHIDAAYYTLEYGSRISGKPIDALSLRFSLFSR